MCGIVGELRLDDAAVDPERLKAARDLLTHRGPDDAGLYTNGPIGLGHRRLSIIDLSPAGRMPMSNETGDVWSVFNGEIYNFAVLRSELERAGHVFRSHTDSEVAIHAYEQWGTACFARFDGMFAIAIWDAKARRLVLARDITGEKPLYYAHAPGRFVKFASTIAPLLVGGEIERAIDPESLRSYLELGFVAGDRAIVAGVRKVEPASFVVFDPGRPPAATAYWSLRDAALARTTAPATSLDEATDQLHEVLRESVRSRLVADVPLGAFLSGGVDSSLVVALMAETSPRAVRTFTIGFREAEYDESEYAHRVAKHLGVENTTMVLSAADVLQELDAITRAFDEPMADFSALPSLAVARLARRHVTVALTGRRRRGVRRVPLLRRDPRVRDVRAARPARAARAAGPRRAPRPERPPAPRHRPGEGRRRGRLLRPQRLLSRRDGRAGLSARDARRGGIPGRRSGGVRARVARAPADRGRDAVGCNPDPARRVAHQGRPLDDGGRPRGPRAVPRPQRPRAGVPAAPGPPGAGQPEEDPAAPRAVPLPAARPDRPAQAGVHGADAGLVRQGAA
jgi:asparagine synthase (glutamine-hydrolysing)